MIGQKFYKRMGMNYYYNIYNIERRIKSFS